MIGKKPTGEHLIKITRSKNWDAKRGKFVNIRQNEYDQMVKSFDYWGMLKEQFFGPQKNRFPKPKLPEVIPDLEKFNSIKNLTYIWLGHSTILLRMEGKTILFDPVFSFLVFQ